MTKKEQFDLVAKARSGDRAAANVLVSKVQNLVRSRAMRLAPINFIDDAIQSGYIGLLHAIQRFDPKYDVLFTTYCIRWVDEYIRKGMEGSVRQVRMSNKSKEIVNLAIRDVPIDGTSRVGYNRLIHAIDEAHYRTYNTWPEDNTATTVEDLVDGLRLSNTEYDLLNKRIMAETPMPFIDIGKAYKRKQESMRRIYQNLLSRVRQHKYAKVK